MPALTDIFADWELKTRQEVMDARQAWAQYYAVPVVGPAFRSKCRNILEFVLVGTPLSIPLPIFASLSPVSNPQPHARDALAVRLFNHYLGGTGKDFALTVADMKAMNTPTKSSNGTGSIKTPQIDIRNTDENTVNPDFAKGCRAADISVPGKGTSYSGILSWGWDNGAISSYTINYSGTIMSGTVIGDCTWTGTVEFVDRFDFDPIWKWSPSNHFWRTATGERRTRIGYILNLGMDFDIASPKANVSQGESDLCITFV